MNTQEQSRDEHSGAQVRLGRNKQCYQDICWVQNHATQKKHQYLEQARRLFMRAKDKVRVAQVDDTRAQVLIAEKKYAQAETIARGAARSLERAGRQCLLAETLINQGIALARLHEAERAQFVLQRAIEIGHQAGALNRAGLAALTMIEEIDTLPREIQSVAYEQAREWLADSESPDVQPRLKAAGKKINGERGGKKKSTDVSKVLFNQRVYLPDEVLKFERGLISETLTKVNGRVTHAAELLGVGYQRLAYIIETRHPDLLKKPRQCAVDREKRAELSNRDSWRRALLRFQAPPRL